MMEKEMDKAYSQVVLTREAFSVAKENLKTIEDRHTLGNVRILLDVFEAQYVLQQARDKYDEAVTNYFTILDESRRADNSLG
jgi:outer membrane protein TolC